MRVLISSDQFIRSPTFTDVNGEAADLDTNPTVSCTRDDGTVLTAPVVSDDTGAGVYKCKLLAATHTTRLDWLTLVWTGTKTGLGTVVQTQTVEVVGGFYVSVPDLRAANNSALGDTVKYTPQQLRETCNEFEDLAELYCGVAFVPRYMHDNAVGDGSTSLLLGRMRPRTLIAATATGTDGTVTAFTTTNWVLDKTGLLTTAADVLTQTTIPRQTNLTIRYTHGYDSPVQAVNGSGLIRAAKIYVAWQLLKDRSQVGRDIRSLTDPAGFNTSYSLPDWEAGRPTGIGEIDQALNAVGRRAPAIA